MFEKMLKLKLKINNFEGEKNKRQKMRIDFLNEQFLLSRIEG